MQDRNEYSGYDYTINPVQLRVQNRWRGVRQWMENKRFPRYYKKMLQRGIKTKLCKNTNKIDIRHTLVFDGEGNPVDWLSYKEAMVWGKW